MSSSINGNTANNRIPYSIASASARRTIRLIAGTVVILPLLGLITAIALALTTGVTFTEIGIFVVMYVVTTLGITVGFHRHYAHNSFHTSTPMRIALGILGSMAGQGPLAWWVATHRRHHRFSDEDGDPHSPQLAKGEGLGRIVKGLWYGHIAWMFSEKITNWNMFARDILNDRTAYAMHRFYFPFVFLGLGLPTLAGGVLIGTWQAALGGLLWGGLVRICLVDHVLWCVGSVCHMYGRKPFLKLTRDHSCNNFWVAFFAFGEGLQNNHHAFPNAAVHGFKWWEPDFSALVIRTMKACGLIWNVRLATSDKRRAAIDANKGIVEDCAQLEAVDRNVTNTLEEARMS